MKKTPITAAGGVLYYNDGEETRVLLIYKRDLWDLPKGKVEGEESVRECAIREVSEEVGTSPPAQAEKLVKTYHEYRESDRLMAKTTYWYAMSAEQREGFRPEREEGITRVAWFTLSEAREKVGYDNLRKVLDELNRFLSGT